MIFEPQIDPAVWRIAPGFRALSLTVARPGGAAKPGIAGAVLAEAVDAVKSGQPAWGEAHLAAWAEVFRRFGAKPQRTPCSAQALRERVLKSGTLSGIDPVVDLYNAVSLKYSVPAGGENRAAYRGNPRLTVAVGDEAFDTMKNGVAANESPDRGEVVWRDETGVTCRRWNWRQGVRTRIDSSVTEMWFVLESLSEMPLAALEDAGDALEQGLRALFGEIPVTRKLMTEGGP